MSNKSNKVLGLPYKVGNKIRILLGGEDGGHTVTFGVIVKVASNGKPIVEYEDLSAMRLCEFDKHLQPNDLFMIGDFKKTTWKY